MSSHVLRAGFDDAPEVYDRTRPVAPPELFDDLVALARLEPGARVVEIGSGTGQATLPLAERGLEVVAVELGARLAAVARAKLAAFPRVRVVTSSFEAWAAEEGWFDAVVAVNSFHWLDDDVRYAKPAALLRDGGALAIVAMHYVLPDDGDPVFAELQADYAATVGETGDAPPHPDAVQGYAAEIDASGLYGTVVSRRYLWNVEYSADDYVALLSTTSWHRQLDEGVRRELLERIHRRISARPSRTIAPSLLATLDVALSSRPVDVELARQQWERGNRRLEEARGDRDAYGALLVQVELVTEELRRRIGQTFTLDELASAYAGADDWARDVLEEAREEDAPPPQASIAADAAFHVYARGAVDYAP